MFFFLSLPCYKLIIVELLLAEKPHFQVFIQGVYSSEDVGENTWEHFRDLNLLR